MLAVLAALFVIAMPGALNTGDSLPPITLIDQNGARVRMDALGGRDVLLSFVSTRQASTSFCPAVTAKFLYLQQHLPSAGYRLVQITRDAAVDSPLRLRRYAAQFGARTGDWRFLTGDPADVARLIASLRAGSATNGYEKLFVISGHGELLGVMPAEDWSPVDAIAWAAALEQGAPAGGATYTGRSPTMTAPYYQARLSLRGNGLLRRLDLFEFAHSPQEPFRSYVADMTKLLHLIVVSDDLRDFQHVHPELGRDGHFRLTLAFPRPAMYHIYADASPYGHDGSVFRFDTPIGENGIVGRPTAVSNGEMKAGPYSVILNEVRVPARQDVPLIVAVQRAGLPATDLHPYLGAYAHVVAIGVTDLSYQHVHPMTAGMMRMGGDVEMPPPLADNAPVPATMTVHIRFPRPGLYKMWFQFRGGARLYSAPFVVQAT